MKVIVSLLLLLPLFSYAEWKNETLFFSRTYLTATDEENTKLVLQEADNTLQVYIRTDRHIGKPSIITHWSFDSADEDQKEIFYCDTDVTAGKIMIPANLNFEFVRSLAVSEKLLFEMHTERDKVIKLTFELEGSKETIEKLLTLEKYWLQRRF